MRGLTLEQVHCAFPLSLLGDASKWNYKLDEKTTGTWEVLTEEFTNKYNYNMC